MAWVKLDTGIFRNPKVVTIGADAKLLYIAGICYAGDNLTDGHIPANAIPILGAEATVRNTKRATADLVAAGLWVPVDNGFDVHDYLEHNSRSQDVHSKRDASRERMQRNRSQNVRANNEGSSQKVRPTKEGRREEVEKKTPKPPLDPMPTEPQAADAARLTPPADPPVDLAVTRTAKQQASDVAYARKLSLFEAWCRGIGLDPESDEASVGRDIAFRQLKALVGLPSPTAEEFEACTRYLAGQSWRDEVPKVPAVINGYGGWVAKNRPAPEANRPAPADARRGLVAG